MEPDQNTKSVNRILIESFLVGFVSTGGMLAAIAVVQYRKRLGEYAKKVARYAVQEAR